MSLAALLAAATLASGAAEVAKLAWLAGAWAYQKDGAVVRETWLAPLDGVMGGVGQTNRPGRPPLVEHMKISAEPGGVTFTAILPGQPPVPFFLVGGGEGEAMFENKAHDFPQRVFYRRCGEALCAGIEGVVEGRLRREEWRYRRAR